MSMVLEKCEKSLARLAGLASLLLRKLFQQEK